MKPNGLENVAVDVQDGSRCHCPCHGRRAPRLVDHVEAALCCDSCQFLHYEAAALERCGKLTVRS